MFKIIPVALFFLSFFASLISNAILRRLSIKYDFLLDKPNLIRKFHKKITPATGGIAISFGIIFSGLFLYAFDDTSQNFNIPSSSSIFGNQLQNTDINNVYEMDLAEGINTKIQRIDDNSFMIIMPSGEKNIYEIDSSEQETSIPPNNIKFNFSKFAFGLFFFTLLIQLFMILDDLWGLKPVTKLLLQSVCVGGLIFISEIYIISFGNLLGFGEIYLGYFGIPITIFCVVGIMNAFNMIDGINGLCASLCLLCLISLIYATNGSYYINIYSLIIPVGAIMGFLMYNLGILGDRAVFLGDNGSNALGFLCAWLLIFLSYPENQAISPPTALWLVAIPFVDAVGVIFVRFLNKIRISKSQRDHIHHKLINLNFSEEAIFSILISCSGILAFVGLYLNNQYAEQSFYSMYAFIIFCGCYYLIISQLQKNV